MGDRESSDRSESERSEDRSEGGAELSGELDSNERVIESMVGEGGALRGSGMEGSDIGYVRKARGLM